MKPDASTTDATPHVPRSQTQCRLLLDLQRASKVRILHVTRYSLGSEAKPMYTTHLVMNKENKEIIVTASGMKGATMGRLDIIFNDSFQKISVSSKQIIICSDKDNHAAFRKCAAILSEV